MRIFQAIDENETKERYSMYIYLISWRIEVKADESIVNHHHVDVTTLVLTILTRLTTLT